MFKCKTSSTEIQRNCGTEYDSFVPLITVATGGFTEGLKEYP
jgi:hypothetical protein